MLGVVACGVWAHVVVLAMRLHALRALSMQGSLPLIGVVEVHASTLNVGLL